MAWMHVRYDRRRFVSAAAEESQRATTGSGVRSVSDRCLLMFITVQLAQFAVTLANGSFDGILALCQALSLLIVARVFSGPRHKDLPGACETTSRADAPAPASAFSTTGKASILTISPPLDIDAQSQTWSDLMSRISHEIRTPLNAIIGFSELMEHEIHGPLGNDRYRDYLAHIRGSGEALLQSSADTLALSDLLTPPPSGQRKQVSLLSQLVAEASKHASLLAARREITIETIIIPQDMEISGCRHGIRQALANMMLEAAQRAIPGSRIEVHAVAHDETVRLNVMALSTDRAVRPTAPSLPVCIARTLLEVQGLPFEVVEQRAEGRWSASTRFDLAVQPDFFALPDRSAPCSGTLAGLLS